MRKTDRVGAAMTRHPKGIDYRLFLRRLRPELAGKILTEHTARAAILEHHSGATPRDAADKTEDELLAEHGTKTQCAAALQRLEKRSPLPDQSDDPARVVCCSEYVLGIHDDDGGEPPPWSADRDAESHTSENGGTA